jgi:hypothetical protein
MNRLPDWRPAFVAAIDAHRPFPFTWGRHDCGILTADCIKSVTGLDIARNFRGHYRCRATGAAFVAMCGYETAVDVVAKRFRAIHPSEAIVGDVAVVPTRRGPALAPVMGAELAAYAPNGVLGAVPLAMARQAFRVEIPT